MVHVWLKNRPPSSATLAAAGPHYSAMTVMHCCAHWAGASSRGMQEISRHAHEWLSTPRVQPTLRAVSDPGSEGLLSRLYCCEGHTANRRSSSSILSRSSSSFCCSRLVRYICRDRSRSSFASCAFRRSISYIACRLMRIQGQERGSVRKTSTTFLSLVDTPFMHLGHSEAYLLLLRQSMLVSTPPQHVSSLLSLASMNWDDLTAV